MNRFGLFTLIYFVLDAYYEDEVKTDEELNTFAHLGQRFCPDNSRTLTA